MAVMLRGEEVKARAAPDARESVATIRESLRPHHKEGAKGAIQGESRFFH